MSTRSISIVLASFVAAALAASCDPIHDSAVDSLGDEAPGIPKGPTHRAGQPCVICHDGSQGSPPQFTVAGTIYVNETAKVAANGAVVTLTSADGKTFSTTSNNVGNFYVTPRDYVPVYPMGVAVTYDGTLVKMTSRVGRDGSCADCHTDPAGPKSAGHIFIPTNGVTP